MVELQVVIILHISAKPEPIMLLVLPIILSRNSYNIYTRYSYFIPMPSPIIPVIFCISDNEVHSI